MHFKEAVRQLRVVEKRARILQRKIDALSIDFQDIRDLIDEKYKKEWKDYCDKNFLHSRYTWGDTLL